MMAPASKLALAATAALLLAAAYYAGASRQSLAIETLTARLELLERNQNKFATGYLNGVPRARLASDLGFSRALPSESSASDSDLQERPAVSAEQRQRDTQERLAGLERAFRSEPVDAKWAGAARQSMEDALVAAAADSGVQPRSYSADCRSRSCMVEMELGSGGELDQVIDAFTTEIGGKLPMTTMVSVPGADGRITVHILGTTPPAGPATRNGAPRG